MALSSALPIKNSRERSGIDISLRLNKRAMQPTIKSLLVCKSLPLLGLVPVNDQAVTESERCAGVCSTV